MSTESSTGTSGRVRPLRLLAALALSLVVITASNAGLSMIGTAVFSAPDDFCAFLPQNSVPMTLEWVALATWRSVLGVVTLDIMVVVGATVTYLALTRIAPTDQLTA